MSLRILVLFLYLVCSPFKVLGKQLCIMLDPAGDAQYVGRKLGDSFERGLTLQCAQEIKQRLEAHYPQVNVVLTRFPGESVAPLQNANFANRLSADVYISLHMYFEEKTKPELFIYTFSWGNDFFPHHQAPLSFCPVEQAHRQLATTTNSWAKIMYKQLTAPTYLTQFDVAGPFKVPFKPLLGIQAPAIALEMGLKNNQDWKHFVEPLTSSIERIIESMAS